MLLGNIVKKSGTNNFVFLVTGNAKKFMYVQVKHKEDYDVLAQIVEMEKEGQETFAKCNILGYRDKDGILKNLRTPLEPGSDVLYANDNFVSDTLGLDKNDKGAYIGVLEDRENIKVYLDLNKLITKHVSVLAKSGSGKSYTVSVLVEEILEKNIPVVIIDPHGEYSSLKYPSENKEFLKKFWLEPRGYYKAIKEYSPDIQKNPETRALKLSGRNLTGAELMHLLPAKLSSSQIGLLYSALSDMSKEADFDQLITSLQAEENNAKWTLINIIEYLKKLNIFSDVYTSVNELVDVGKCSIINLRGVPSEVQEVIIYKVVSDLFNARKGGIIPPFFLVLEEAHNFAPERSFGEVKSSSILRQVIAEGRKFGLGVCVVTQRPVRLDKTILSQCNTQIIMKITNPNDLRSISSGVEGITSETENEIVNLHIGNALVAGIADTPLFIQVRPRRTKHGGEAIDIVGTFCGADKRDDKAEVNVIEDVRSSKRVLSLIRPKVMKKDIQLLVNNKIKSLKAILVPCCLVSCRNKSFEFNLLLNLTNGHVVTDLERGLGKNIDVQVSKLSEKESRLFGYAVGLNKDFTAADLFSKSGLMFSEVYDIINDLVKKGFFIKLNSNYALSDAVKMFVNLKDLACYGKNEFMNFEYDEEMEAKYNLDFVLDILKRFVDVTSYKECFIVKYDIEYEK